MTNRLALYHDLSSTNLSKANRQHTGYTLFGAVCDKPAAESKAIVVGGKKNRVTKGHEKSQKGTNKRAKWKDLALDSTKLRPGLKQRSQSTAKYQRPMTITASMFP